MPIIRTPIPTPTIKTILGCFPLLEVLSSVEDEGLYEGAPTGDAAKHGVVNQSSHNKDRNCCKMIRKQYLARYYIDIRSNGPGNHIYRDSISSNC